MSATEHFQDDCLFCKFGQGIIPVPKLLDEPDHFAIRDIDPQAPTHILIIPKNHCENAAEVAINQPDVLAAMFTSASKLAGSESLDGYRAVFNTGASAGQSVFHAHLHLLGGRSFQWPPG